MKRKTIFGLVAAAAMAASLVASPAFSAASDAAPRAASFESAIGQLTPAFGDPRLLARYAQVSEEAKRKFRFTPIVARSSDGSRAITVVVRARPQSVTAEPTRSIASTVLQTRDKPIAIAPVAYNLGKSVGLTKFSIPGAGTGVDLASLPKTRAPVDPTERPSRFSLESQLASEASAADAQRAIDGAATRSVDVGAGYSLTRRVKVTAGVRYSQEDDRLTTSPDQRRDNQAVYVGTRFKF